MKKILLVLGLLLFPTLAQAQSNARNPCYYSTPTSTNCQPVSSTTPLPVLATVSASVSGFTPNLSYATLTATATSASVALPTGTTIALQNTGTATVSCTLGVGSATATANQIQVPASSTVFVTPGSNTFAACIDQTGSTSNAVVLAGGTGLGAGFGGGGGGAGGSSAITTWGGATLGAATAWGVAPTGNVNGVNANIVAGSISVSNFPATQTVAGTVTANLGTLNGAATAANQATEISSLSTIATNSGTQATAANQATANASLATIATNSSTPLPAQSGNVWIGNVGFDPSARSPLSAAISVSTITTTQLVALSGSTLIYVTSFDVIAGGTGNITFVYGTGSSCGTGTTSLTGAYPLTAQAGISKGSGVATILKVPAGNALCVTTSAAVQMSGSVSYMQF